MYIYFFNPIAIIFFAIIIFEIYMKIYKITRGTLYNIDNLRNFKGYIRDINCNYTPSVLSFLLDTNIELKDIAADIMNLYAKKNIRC